MIRMPRLKYELMAYLGSENKIEADRKPQDEFTNLPVNGIYI